MAGCIICGGEREEWLNCPIDAKTLRPTPYGRVTRCRDCGLGAVEPLPSPEELPAFYQLEAYYTHGESHFQKGEAQSFSDRVRDNLSWRFDKGEPANPEALIALAGKPAGETSVLDIGCGHGALLKRFQKLGAKTAGLDPDPDALSHLKEAGIEAHQGTGEAPAASLDGRVFDIVAMTHSLEHCLDPMKALATAYALVRPGGVFLCEVPNCACTHFERFNIISEMFDAPRHLYFFTPENLRMAIERAGFVVESDYYDGFLRHFQNAWRATENHIRDGVVKNGGATSAMPPVHSRGETIRLLMETALSSKEKKYDCVGFVSRRPASAQRD